MFHKCFFQLGVNPYSTNKTLQDELNRVGWSEAGGTVMIHMATAAIPEGAPVIKFAINIGIAMRPIELDVPHRLLIDP